MHCLRGYHALITWLITTYHVTDRVQIIWLIMKWSRGWSYSAHVTDHAHITWLSCTDHVAIMHWYHALITWLITHVSRDRSCTDHVAIMHWSRFYHALITWLCINWTRTCSYTVYVAIMHWSSGWSYSAPETDHALITWLSCTVHVADHTLITCLVMHRSRD